MLLEDLLMRTFWVPEKTLVLDGFMTSQILIISSIGYHIAQKMEANLELTTLTRLMF